MAFEVSDNAAEDAITAHTAHDSAAEDTVTGTAATDDTAEDAETDTAPTDSGRDETVTGTAVTDRTAEDTATGIAATDGDPEDAMTGTAVTDRTAEDTATGIAADNPVIGRAAAGMPAYTPEPTAAPVVGTATVGTATGIPPADALAADTGQDEGLVPPPAEADGPLLPDAADLRANWQRLQSAFVDDPRESVVQAADLVDHAAQALVGALQQRQRQLRDMWDDEGESPDTEQLRLAIKRYRAVFDQICPV